VYCDFFRLSEKPFDVTPDPKFLYLSPQHQEALASLIYGIRERRGFIVMVGEVGTGKTTLLNALLDRLDDQTGVAYIFNTRVDFDTLLNGALVDLGISDAHEFFSSWDAINRLNRFAIEALRAGRNVVLIVDEAQNLERGCMESLRLLSNLETRKHKLIQIVLSGQPELNIKLQDPQLRQLTQRISLRRYITHMGEEDTYAYIQHRLNIAQYKGSSLFDRKARERIWTYSGGIPRKINTLCDNALLIAYGLKKKRVKLEVVEEAIMDLNGMPASEEARGVPMEVDVPFQFQTPGPAKRGLHPGYVLALVGSLLLFLVFTFWPHPAKETPRALVHWNAEHGEAVNVGTVLSPIMKQQAPQAAPPAASNPEHAKRAFEAESRPEEGIESATLPVEKEMGQEIEKATTSVEETSELPVAPPDPVKKQKDPPAASNPEHAKQAFEAESRPEEGIESAALPGEKEMGQEIEKATTSVEETSELPVAPPDPVKNQKDPSAEPVVAERTIVVQYGDTLFQILSNAYGQRRYNQATVRAVQEKNPDLSNPDKILSGQTIRLPNLKKPPMELKDHREKQKRPGGQSKPNS
jgi:type II secretory pathway predicted ATPase ExeA/nucleoid-associated protein YgaU